MLIRIPSLNCVITLGDFLLAARSRDSILQSVCIVCDIIFPSQLKVTWWLSREELITQGNVEIPPPLGIDTYSNLLKCRIKEVIKDCSTLALINVFDI
jgi:hypothetical protein